MQTPNSKLIPVFVRHWPEFGQESLWGHAQVTEKVEGALVKWRLQKFELTTVPVKSRYFIEGDDFCGTVYHKDGLFYTPVDPTPRGEFNKDFGPFELIPIPLEQQPKKLLEGFKPPTIEWKYCRNFRGGIEQDKTPEIPSDGQFADGTPVWYTSWQGNDFRYRPGIVSTMDGYDVFGVNHPYSGTPHWWYSIVVPDFWNHEQNWNLVHLKLEKMPVSRVKLCRSVDKYWSYTLWGETVASVVGTGSVQEDRRAMADALVEPLPFFNVADMPQGKSKTVEEAVEEITPQAIEGDFLEVYPKGGAWHAFHFIRKDGAWYACGFRREEANPSWVANEPGIKGCPSFFNPNDALKSFGIEPNLNGWREPTQEELESARQRAQAKYDEVYKAYVVERFYFPEMHREVEKWREILQAIDEKLALFPAS